MDNTNELAAAVRQRVSSSGSMVLVSDTELWPRFRWMDCPMEFREVRNATLDELQSNLEERRDALHASEAIHASDIQRDILAFEKLLSASQVVAVEYEGAREDSKPPWGRVGLGLSFLIDAKSYFVYLSVRPLRRRS